MKRLIFLLMAFTLTLSVSIANDVGNDRSNQLPTCYVEQLTTLLPAMVIPAADLTTPVVCITQDKQLMAVDFKVTVAQPDGLLFIDPGRCTQVSVAKFNFTNRNSYQTYSYTPYKLNEYNLSTRNCKVFVLTARHVFFIV